MNSGPQDFVDATPGYQANVVIVAEHVPAELVAHLYKDHFQGKGSAMICPLPHPPCMQHAGPDVQMSSGNAHEKVCLRENDSQAAAFATPAGGTCAVLLCSKRAVSIHSMCTFIREPRANITFAAGGRAARVLCRTSTPAGSSKTPTVTNP